jgi:hypothetical protein
METISRFMEAGKDKSQSQICYDIASEIWIRINTLESDGKKPVSKRMGVKMRDRHLIEMKGLKIALRLALGITWMPDEMNVDAFLNAFQQERLARSRGE